MRASSSLRAARCRFSGSARGRRGVAAPSMRSFARSRSATGTSTPRRRTGTKSRWGRQSPKVACRARRSSSRRSCRRAAQVVSERHSRTVSSALGFGYVDLWLVHWPPGGLARPDVWERLLELQAEGLAREVGVSNYSVRQLDELERATGRLPAVNQIEWSPALFDRNVLEAHRRRGVQLEGYSPLKTMNLRDPRLARIAEDHGVTRPRSSSAGTSSTGSSRSRSRRTRSGSPRTQPSSTSS